MERGEDVEGVGEEEEGDWEVDGCWVEWSVEGVVS